MSGCGYTKDYLRKKQDNYLQKVPVFWAHHVTQVSVLAFFLLSSEWTDFNEGKERGEEGEDDDLQQLILKQKREQKHSAATLSQQNHSWMRNFRKKLLLSLVSVTLIFSSCSEVTEFSLFSDDSSSIKNRSSSPIVLHHHEENTHSRSPKISIRNTWVEGCQWSTPITTWW